jgi:hypothetical protein
MSRDATCDVCHSPESPVATTLSGLHAHSRICRDCAECAQNSAVVVQWDDPRDNPQHEVNQPPQHN